MADRFSGSIEIHGRVSKLDYEEAEELIAEIADEEMEDGHLYFQECNSSDMEDLVAFCVDKKITLEIAWDAKYEFDGQWRFGTTANTTAISALKMGTLPSGCAT